MCLPERTDLVSSLPRWRPAETAPKAGNKANEGTNKKGDQKRRMVNCG